jgi:hypothetical protein
LTWLMETRCNKWCEMYRNKSIGCYVPWAPLEIQNKVEKRENASDLMCVSFPQRTENALMMSGAPIGYTGPIQAFLTSSWTTILISDQLNAGSACPSVVHETTSRPHATCWYPVNKINDDFHAAWVTSHLPETTCHMSWYGQLLLVYHSWWQYDRSRVNNVSSSTAVL